MDQKLHDELERKVDEHSIQIQELHDEIDFKKWKIDSLITKIDNLTDVVQQIQLNQIRDDSDIKNRVTALESSQTNTRWFIGICMTAMGLVLAYLSLKGGI